MGRKAKSVGDTEEQSNSARLDTTATKPPKPARASRRQLGAVLQVVRALAVRSAATKEPDVQDCITFLQRAMLAAPAGQPTARARYAVDMPDGTVHTLTGLGAVCSLVGRARSTVANALSSGRGVAELPRADANGNPSVLTIRRIRDA